MFPYLRRRASRMELQMLALGGYPLRGERGMETSFQHAIPTVRNVPVSGRETYVPSNTEVDHTKQRGTPALGCL